MASNITANQKAALVQGVRVVYDRVQGVLASITGYKASVTDMMALAGVYALPSGGLSSVVGATQDHRDALATIQEHGRAMLTPVLLSMGRSAASRTIEGDFITDWPRLFRDINADLTGGTPDYVTARGISFASNPAASATGIFRRLTKDIANESIEDGLHNQTKVIRIVGKPARYYSTAQIEGQSNEYGDALDVRNGRPRVTSGLVAYNDVQTPSGIFNPYLTPSDLTDEADITSIANWTIATSGSYTFKAETTAANLWRSRAYALRFTGANASYVELSQVIPANVFSDPFRPWDFGVPIKLESGWQGTIDLTWGGKTQQFTHSDLSSGAYVHVFPDLDYDLYPKRFDAAGASWKLKLTNSQLNTNSIWVAGFIPQPMVKHEGLWYSHFSDVSEPTIESTVSYADTCAFTGIIQEVLSFLFHELAPGDAHLATSSAATIADPTYVPEIGITRSGVNVADGGTIALGSVASGAHSVTLVIANSGTAALSVAVPVDVGGATNATLTGAGLTGPVSIAPGATQSVVVEVTDGGAGAFSLTIRIDNNDSSEGTYEITISGTAT